MNNEFNNQNMVSNLENNNSFNDTNTNDKNNKWKDTLILILVIIVFILTALSLYLVINTKDNDTNNDNKNNHEENSNLNNNNQYNEENSKYLKLKDFPLEDDSAETSEYIKFKGIINALNGTLDEGKGVYKASYENINFTLECVDSSTFCDDSTISTGLGKIECTSASLKLNDKIVYGTSSNEIFPYIIITNKYIIIRSEVDEYLNVGDYTNNLFNSGKIYIYNLDFEKIYQVDNVNTYEMSEKVDKLNNSLEIAIKDNVLYYITANGDKRFLKCIDLNEEKLSEVTIQEFEKNKNIERNDKISSIAQFPLESTVEFPATINNYYIERNWYNESGKSRGELVIKNLDSNVIKKIDDAVWYVNPNGYEYSTVGEIYNNKLYYLIDNGDETISLKSIDLNKNIIEEIILDTFKKIDYANINYGKIILGIDHNPDCIY